MTPDKIRNEPAGPKLDAWVAEHIFKWFPPKHSRTEQVRKTRGLTHSYYDTHWCQPDEQITRNPPKYSTDMADTWKVASKLNYYRLRIEKDPCGWGEVVFSMPSSNGDKWLEYRAVFNHFGELPVAICRAALLATNPLTKST